MSKFTDPARDQDSAGMPVVNPATRPQLEVGTSKAKALSRKAKLEDQIELRNRFEESWQNQLAGIRYLQWGGK